MQVHADVGATWRGRNSLSHNHMMVFLDQFFIGNQNSMR